MERNRPQAGRREGPSREEALAFQRAKIMQWMRRSIQIGTNAKTWTCLVAIMWMFTVTENIEGAEKGEMETAIALPDSAAGWTWDKDEMGYDARTVFGYMDGGAELYLAYGFQHLRVRKFEWADHPPITLELYEMASSEDASGVFAFERHDDAVGIGQGSEFGAGLLRFWKGRYFVRIYADWEGADVDSAILAMGRTTAEGIRETGAESALVALIPGKSFGLVDRSVCFLRNHVLLNQRLFIAHQNILNLTPRTEVVLAQYAAGEQTIQLLLVHYPSAKEAAVAYESFMSAYRPDALGKGAVKTEERKSAMARRRGEAVVIVFGAPTAADAEALLKATENRLPESR
jgi:hypothetical protein